jgi:outer membrane receptor for monomeric catechols
VTGYYCNGNRNRENRNLPRERSESNGRIEAEFRELAGAQASLIAAQAAQAQPHAAIEQVVAGLQIQKVETDRLVSERFARIEAILIDHSRILQVLVHMLERLPEVVREKIGFRSPSDQR